VAVREQGNVFNQISVKRSYEKREISQKGGVLEGNGSFENKNFSLVRYLK
jgi:hypothetical protein